MSGDSFKELQAIIRRRRDEAERAATPEEQSEVWRSAAAEIRFKSFETLWRKEGRETR